MMTIATRKTMFTLVNKTFVIKVTVPFISRTSWSIGSNECCIPKFLSENLDLLSDAYK
jgi:hypothetical protein